MRNLHLCRRQPLNVPQPPLPRPPAASLACRPGGATRAHRPSRPSTASHAHNVLTYIHPKPMQMIRTARARRTTSGDRAGWGGPRHCAHCRRPPLRTSTITRPTGEWALLFPWGGQTRWVPVPPALQRLTFLFHCPPHVPSFPSSHSVPFHLPILHALREVHGTRTTRRDTARGGIDLVPICALGDTGVRCASSHARRAPLATQDAQRANPHAERRRVRALLEMCRVPALPISDRCTPHAGHGTVSRCAGLCATVRRAFFFTPDAYGARRGRWAKWRATMRALFETAQHPPSDWVLIAHTALTFLYLFRSSIPLPSSYPHPFIFAFFFLCPFSSNSPSSVSV
ncbi:hypothetical protein C8J57DRAFT_1594589 [Mycena rebaudengoi]|nr:hypothetical protein C8J57DRAFT_1594589 [Mycena rebaudengoi]